MRCSDQVGVNPWTLRPPQLHEYESEYAGQALECFDNVDTIMQATWPQAHGRMMSWPLSVSMHRQPTGATYIVALQTIPHPTE